jgi:alpha-N-acetylglucosamine transferase
MTEFKKIIYMDTDTLVLKNVDHLALEPTFTCKCYHL